MKKRNNLSISYFFKQRKTGNIALDEAGTLILAVPIVIAIIMFIFLVLRIFPEKDDGSIKNLDRIHSQIRTLMENTDDIAYVTDVYSLGGSKVLIGFDTNWDEGKIIIGRQYLSTPKVYKPFKCGNSACLCLTTKLTDNPTNKDDGVISCRSEAFTGKNVVFLSEGGNVAPKTEGIERADKKGNYLVFLGKNWGGTQNTYIEKKKENDVHYIYISKIDIGNDKDPVNIRKKEIDTALSSKDKTSII